MHDEDPASRPATPGSPLTSSLHHATATIDDLTMALVNFSRVPSPEPPNLLVCCCGGENCENSLSWLECKSRLESRLTLSGEVGQALLQRHEAYVRQHEGRESRQVSPRKPRASHSGYIPSTPENTTLDLIELVKEKTILEKRLNQALVNNEVTEVSNKTIIQELQEARTTISRLTAQHARSVGWETRLSAAILDKDDMQQERDSESHRAKLAESRLAAMRDKAAKLQSEVRRLQDALEERRQHRLESSETILQDARARLESLYNSLNSPALADQTELMEVLESLVNDNEALKRDNAELQHLLAESREEIHSLQEEVEEQRAILPSRGGAGTPHLRANAYTSSVPSSLLKEQAFPNHPRSESVERKPCRPFELLTPETSQRPLSPADSLAHSESKWIPFNRPQSHYASSHVSFEVDESVNNDEGFPFPEKLKTHKTLLLLTRSRAVQTETWPGLLSPSSLPSYGSSSSPHDPRSESSSFSESPSSNFSILLERIVALNNRLVQADALTLTNRLKRQHLKGADVGHLSRSTVNNILSETTGLRAQFRFLLEDENTVTPCTRKDFRALFKLLKDVFTEMGQMRITLNDIILDPAQAIRISELALNPSKGEIERRENERENAGASVANGWMAPISKLFSPGGRSERNTEERTGLLRSVSGRGTSRPPRFVPKLGPALSASATTVNVEFSGTGVGRSTTSTAASPATLKVETPEVSSIFQGPSPGVMGIFAGAPRNDVPDPWIVVPKGPRRVQSFMKPKDEYTPATIRRSSTKSGLGSMGGLSRDVDAVIDVEGPLYTDEEPDYVAPLLERTLRRRGLSDSSIHSTFTNQADDTRPSAIGVPPGDGTRPDRTSVFETLSRTVQSFRMTTSGTEASAGSSTATLSPKKPSSAERLKPVAGGRTLGPGLHTFLPNLSSWAAAGTMLDPIAGAEPFLVGSVRGESLVRRTRPGESHGHEYF
ncbi:hypothetical protein BDZ94DRAFT_1262166 [Collybia nuda]|uniref:Uncharacterized protein n=1 Tax=Collybia nuda TaxID=64659 RepID=A0A9P5Y3G5_9AGAR|nr:hypothetical protein BDZ94DRAFT_1262166 [Collybia nuda]